MPPLALTIRERAAQRVLRGHPWIYQEQIESSTEHVSSGDAVRIVCGGSTLGVGIFTAGSPLAVRLWTRHGDLDEVLPARIERALSRRDALFPSTEETTAYRCVNGEGDRTPGFVVDRYDHVAVVRTDGDGALARLAWFTRALWPKLRARGVTSLVHRESASASGDEAPESLVVHEHGVPMQVDLARGQKTGAFLDQRENRRRVQALARGRRVLNLFSYAGGFSLRAALGGAVKTTSVDVAMHAHAAAQASFKLAGLDPARHAFVTADAFQFLKKAHERGERWDLVISDPPSFAPRESAKPSALAAYKKLHRMCAAVLEEDGIFCAASCSSHVTESDFLATLDDGALERSDLSVREVHGAPPDHPALAGWLEGRYLKFVVLS